MWFVNGSEGSSMAFAHLSGNGCPMAKTPGVGKPMNKLPWLGPAVKARNQWVCNMPSPCIHQCPMLLHDCPMQLSNAQCPMHIIAQWSIPNTGAHCPMHHMHHVTCNSTSHTNASAHFFHTHFQNPCPVQTCHTSPAHYVFAHGQGVLLVHVRPLHHCLVDPLNHNGMP